LSIISRVGVRKFSVTFRLLTDQRICSLRYHSPNTCIGKLVHAGGRQKLWTREPRGSTVRGAGRVRAVPGGGLVNRFGRCWWHDV